MIAEQPRETIVMAHHATCIEEQKDKGNVVQRIGKEEHRNKRATALNNRFRPVSLIGV